MAIFKNSKNYTPNYEYINDLMARIELKHNISMREISRQARIGYSTLRDWRTGRSRPDYAGQYILESMLESDGIELIGRNK